MGKPLFKLRLYVIRTANKNNEMKKKKQTHQHINIYKKTSFECETCIYIQVIKSAFT